MLYYRDQFMTILEDGFIQRPRYMDVYVPHTARVAIEQLRVSSHRLEIEAGRAALIPREHTTCRICRSEVESEEHYVCSCRAYHDIRSHYTALFSGQPALRELMESRDQRQLGRFLLEIQRHRDLMLQSPSGDRQSKLTDFFLQATPTPPIPTTQRGVTIQQAEVVRARRRPSVVGYRTQRAHQREIHQIRAHYEQASQKEIHQVYSNPAIILQGLFTPYPPMNDILHPQFGTGWS
ncbi:hypothetical protein L7F22_038430 [Adiantum nelumboides]|nr:hypothetical protein [Adiantum nelumboides]